MDGMGKTYFELELFLFQLTPLKFNNYSNAESNIHSMQ